MATSVVYINSLSMWVYPLYAGHDSGKVLQAVRSCCPICRWVLPLHHHPQLYIACVKGQNVLLVLFYVSAYRQLSFSLYSGAIMTRHDSSCYNFISDHS